jgi:hypothetical protein
MTRSKADQVLQLVMLFVFGRQPQVVQQRMANQECGPFECTGGLSVGGVMIDEQASITPCFAELDRSLHRCTYTSAVVAKIRSHVLS